jgi:hypothetical protein
MKFSLTELKNKIKMLVQASRNSWTISKLMDLNIIQIVEDNNLKKPKEEGFMTKTVSISNKK